MTDTAKFLYLTEFDLSLDNGHGINEREFVSVLRREYADEMMFVMPALSRPDVYFDPAIHYVFAPRGNAALYSAFVAAALRRIAAIRRRHRIAAVVCRLGPTPILPFALQTLGMPVVLKTVALYSRFGSDQRMRHSRTQGAGVAARAAELLMPMYRSVLRSAIHGDTVSPVYAAWLNERFGMPLDRLQIVPNGFNPDAFTGSDTIAARRAVALERFDYLVGYVGSLSEVRYLDLLVDSFAKLDRELNAGLVLVGDGSGRSALEARAKDRGVTDRVVFTGKVPYATVPRYMQALDVAVDLTVMNMRVGARTVPSSFSQKIPQYLGTGVPVVAWDTVDTQFLAARRIGALVPIELPALLRDSLDRLLCLSDMERREWRQRARQYAESNLSIEHLTSLRVDAWRRALRCEPGLARHDAARSATDSTTGDSTGETS